MDRVPFPFKKLRQENLNKLVTIQLSDYLTGFETDDELKRIELEFKKYENIPFDINSQIHETLVKDVQIILGASLELYIETQKIECIFQKRFPNVPTNINKLHHFHIFNSCTSATYSSK